MIKDQQTGATNTWPTTALDVEAASITVSAVRLPTHTASATPKETLVIAGGSIVGTSGLVGLVVGVLVALLL
jgi:hypothetical protein